MSAIGEYINYQKGIFQSHLSKIIKSSKHEIIPNNDKYVISWKIVFKDESVLEAWEILELSNNAIEKKRYGYEYIRRSGFFFFYELDDEKNSIIEKIKKPKYHLHVGVKKEYSSQVRTFPELLDHNGPHYKASSITIDEIIGIIVINFFEENTDLLNRFQINLS